ncbi:MAG: site-specific integrase, partial [Acidiferrobacterales bacterium]
MSLYRRKTVWWVRFTTPAGQRVRRPTGTADKKQAQEFHDRLKAELWKVQKLAACRT